MLKKIFLIFILTLGFLLIAPTFSACNYDGEGNIASAIDNCLSDSDIVASNGTFSVENQFKTKINTWTRAIAGILALLAVGSIVYGGLLMTLSAGEDEKIKKGKDVVKWSIIGFLWVITAGWLISLVVNFIFGVAS